MPEPDTSLRDAIRHQLETAHGLDAEDAARRAAAMLPDIAPRFATWVRRELTIQEGRRERVRRREERAAVAVGSGRTFLRFSVNIRLQHALMAVSVVILILTGIPLKFHEAGWARAIIALFGGPDVSPIVHRVGATGLILVGLWHLLYITATREGRQTLLLLLPRPQDAVDAFKQIRYFLGRSEDRPRFDKFSYVEKFDYWAVYWGMVIMIGSGTLLWFTDFFLRHVPKWVTDIAKEAHSDEALLATLAIVVWHFYNVHFNPHKFPMNRTFLSGRISEHEMIEEHPLEYERILAAERAAGGGQAAAEPPDRRAAASADGEE